MLYSDYLFYNLDYLLGFFFRIKILKNIFKKNSSFSLVPHP